MNINIDELKKKIIYRANYRGTKEMDTLLGAFTKKYIDDLVNQDLLDLLNFLEIDDENLYKLIQKKLPLTDFPNNKISKLFNEFIYKRD